MTRLPREVVDIVEDMIADRVASAPGFRLDDLDATWTEAFVFWREGDDTRLLALVAGAGAIPAFAREWLAAILAGKIKRKRGRKDPAVGKSLRESIPGLVRQWDVQRLYARHLDIERCKELRPGEKDVSPSARAISAVAQKMDMSERQVSEIVHPRKKR